MFASFLLNNLFKLYNKDYYHSSETYINIENEQIDLKAKLSNQNKLTCVQEKKIIYFIPHLLEENKISELE